ncbi:MAG TPA: adenylate/guanylate cyclase domain-containing protein [Stellaceae bacterium]|nr:adenylate/guanylate cyclase domain-containing protein [Stellaceae bacterium]
MRSEFVDPKIAEHRGRIVKTTGDGLLVEYASVVDAVRCAVAVQQAMPERNTGVAADNRIELRIGINLGDVIVEGDDLYGDGVNIAARIEALADAGGVLVSNTVYDHVRDRLPFVFEDLGEQQVKNIARPVRVYRVCDIGAARGPSAAAPPVLPLPDKPSIAVLPFANMSGDLEQEYFADGMVEEIITALSRIRWLFVIARNSSFTYKGQAVDVKQVGRELGVRYVLEGSVRKASDRVRITAQLIDANSGTHLWADRFDRSLEDIFDLQDQLASGVIGAIEPKLRQSEIERAIRKPTESLNAYDLYLRALAESEKGEAGLRKAVALLKTALAIDPSYAAAAARIAYCRIILRSHGFQVSEEEMAETGQLAAQAVRFGNDDPEALAMGAHGAIYFSRADGIAESASDRALALNPNSAWAWVARGWVLVLRNRPEPAIEAFERAMRLSPLDPHTYYFLGGVAFAYLYRRRFEEAIEWADRSLNHEPNFTPVLRVKLVACAHLGRVEEARQCRRRVDELQPGLTIAQVKNYPGMSVSPEIMDLFADGFRKAGVPET